MLRTISQTNVKITKKRPSIWASLVCFISIDAKQDSSSTPKYPFTWSAYNYCTHDKTPLTKMVTPPISAAPAKAFSTLASVFRQASKINQNTRAVGKYPDFLLVIENRSTFFKNYFDPFLKYSPSTSTYFCNIRGSFCIPTVNNDVDLCFGYCVTADIKAALALYLFSIFFSYGIK